MRRALAGEDPEAGVRIKGMTCTFVDWELMDVEDKFTYEYIYENRMLILIILWRLEICVSSFIKMSWGRFVSLSETLLQNARPWGPL